MNDEELKQWNALRLELFAGCRIPDHALAAILHDARRLDFNRAMRALPIYRAAKPYRGFYAVDWARHYEQTSARTAADGTAVAQERSAARRMEDERKKAEDDKLREIADYFAIPVARRREAAEKLGYLGWRPDDDSRAWRIIVRMWNDGDDVSQLYNPSKLCKSLPEKPSPTVNRDELARELRALIRGCQMQLAEMGEQS